MKACSQTDHSRSAMLPLGDAWDGICRAQSGSPYRPDEVTLLNFCNLGYARGCCTRCPDDDGPDAVRFTLSRDDSEGLYLYYVLERNHHPLAHGPLEFSPAGTIRAEPSAGETACRLAHTYVASYLRRKSEASALPAASR